MAIGQRLKQIGKMTSAVMAALIQPQVGRDELADAVGYIENAGTPGSVTPDFIGQWLFDTTNTSWYRSYGVASGNWLPMGDDSLSMTELAALDGATSANDTTGKAAILGTSGAATFAGTVTVPAIAGSDSSLDIVGFAAAQGGDVVVTGGASSTGANAGGVGKVIGGTPGVTGVGGAATVVGAAGGATSGAGGVGSVSGGAGTAGNSAGGVGKCIGGAGQGSAAGGDAQVIGGAGGATGAGGVLTLTSGAGGATSGAAGAVNISVGAAISGNGAAMTLTAGNGAGGTNSGGHLNLVGGAAVSTGTPGEVQVNGDSSLLTVNVPLTATDATRTVLVATRACRLKAVKEVHSTASSSGTLQLEKCTGTTAPGSGSSLLTGTMSLAGTANTVVSGTLVATVATITLAAGDRLSIVIAGTMTNLVGGVVSVTLAPC